MLTCDERSSLRFGELVSAEFRVHGNSFDDNLLGLFYALYLGFRQKWHAEAVDLSVVPIVDLDVVIFAIQAARRAVDLRLQKRLRIDPHALGLAVFQS